MVIGTDRDSKTGAVRALLAAADSDGLSYAGAAFIALGGDERSAFFDQLEQLKTSWAAFKSSRLLDVQWCKPALVVKVKHLAGSKVFHSHDKRRLAPLNIQEPGRLEHRPRRFELLKSVKES